MHVAVSKVRDVLMRELADLHAESRRLDRRVGAMHDADDRDSIDHAQSDSIEPVLYELGTQIFERIAVVKEALERLDNGCYGICVDCDAHIPQGRLEIVPCVVRCLPCQEQAELERLPKRYSRRFEYTFNEPSASLHVPRLNQPFPGDLV